MKKIIPVLVSIYILFPVFAAAGLASAVPGTAAGGTVEAYSSGAYSPDGADAAGDVMVAAMPDEAAPDAAAVPGEAGAEYIAGETGNDLSEEAAVIGGADASQVAVIKSEEDEGLTEKLAMWFNDNLSGKIGGELTAFVVSLFPILECRGGMIVAKICDINLLKAFVLCYIGNMIPVPFILLFIKQIFKFMKKHNILKGFIEKLEGKGEKNREKILRYKQWGLFAFVAVPLPGTGGWTGSLFASLLNIEFKKSLPIVALGVFVADLIMAIVTYGAGALFNF